MKNRLDSIIKVEFPNISESGKYYYYVVRAIELNNKVIYTGRSYLADGESKINIYLNDIIENFIFNLNIFDLTSAYSGDANLIASTFFVELYSDYALELRTATKIVYPFLNSGYPFKDYAFPFATPILLDLSYPTALLPYLLGISHYSYSDAEVELELTPRYPALNTNNLRLTQVFNLGKEVKNVFVGPYNDSDFVSYIQIDTSRTPYNAYFSIPLSDISDIELGENITVSQNDWIRQVERGDRLWQIVIYSNYSMIYDDPVYSTLQMFGYDYNFMQHCQAHVENNYYYVLSYETDVDFRQELLKALLETASDNQTYFKYTIQQINETPVYTLALNPKQMSAVEVDEFVDIAVDVIPDMTEQKLAGYGIIKGQDFTSENVFIPVETSYRITDEANIYALEDYLRDMFILEDGTNTIAESPVNETTYESEYGRVGEYYGYKIADIDYCPAKYYLQWMDRFGGVQCQPFDGRALPKIDYSKSEIKDLFNYRRITNVGTQAKWELNSNWLTEDVYPFYESILASPYLYLYDTRNDKGYNVIITDTDYTEKSYENQDTLFNFTINIEENIEKRLTF